jgi:hypothetical protein
MPLPLNPSNNQTAVMRGIKYTYNSTKGAWTVDTNSEVSYTMAAVTTTGLVTAANIKTTSGVFWSNGAPYGGSAGGSTNSIQYNSSNTFAGATNFTYTAQTGNVVIGATTTSTSSSTGALVVAGGVGIAGNLNTGSTSINGSLVGSTTSPLQITGDVTLSGANRSVLGNMYYQGDWKYAANGAAWGFRENNGGKLQFVAAPVNSSGALAAASPTYPITLDLTSGNVAIGFDSPTSTLHIRKATNATYFEPTGNWAGKIFNATDAANEHGLVVGQRWAAAASTAFEVGSTYGGGTGSWRSYFKIDGLGGMTMSSGGSERIVMDSTTGNLIINATTVSTSATTGALVVKGGAGIAGNVTSGQTISASGTGGFSSSTYAVGARNPIWRFGNADGYGLSYFQGASGVGGGDSIGLHFGTATAAGSFFQINQGAGTVVASAHVNPSATNTYDLGTSSLRWRNIYTQDLHLSNGIGDYTVIEGVEDLFLVNNKSGRSFKFALIEVDPAVVPPKSHGN